MRCRPPLILVSVVAVAACSLLAAGCGGGGSPGVASVASSTAASTTAAATTTTQTGTIASAFAFARCMRSHGIPGWPDPNSHGFFDKSKLRPLGLSVSRVLGARGGSLQHPAPEPPGVHDHPCRSG